jgi:hypothetical protein
MFAYRIPKEKHDTLLNIVERLARIYKKHGMLWSRIYQLGHTQVFEGFDGFEKALDTSSGEEVWVEVDSYPNPDEFHKIVALIGEDQDAGPLWEELAKVTAGRSIIMGEFLLLTKE